MPSPMTITIPGTFNRILATNALRGRVWQATTKAKEDLKDRAWLALKEQGGDPCDPVNCFQKDVWPLILDWEIYFEQKDEDGRFRRRYDQDNLAPALKPVQDQIARFLGMNDRDFRTGEVIQHLWSQHKSEPRIVVTIYPGDYWIRVPRKHYEMAVNR